MIVTLSALFLRERERFFIVHRMAYALFLGGIVWEDANLADSFPGLLIRTVPPSSFNNVGERL